MSGRHYGWLSDPRRKYEDARFETCKVCGREWNVSKHLVIDWRGYTCPQCIWKDSRDDG